MIKNRVRELRKHFNMSQYALSIIIGTTQQTISRIENCAYDIPSDLLVKMANYFNVTTDYILGISDVKRNLDGQVRMSQELDKYYDIILRYQNLSEINKKTFCCILNRLEQAQTEYQQLDEMRMNTGAKDSDM